MPPRMKTSRFRRTRRKPCQFCIDHQDYIDYKAHQRLKRFTSDRGKILPRKTSGVCARHHGISRTPSSAPARSRCSRSSRSKCA